MRNQPDPLLHDNKAVAYLMPARDIGDALTPIDAAMTGMDRLRMAGTDAIIQAIGAGHTIKAICDHLGVSLSVYLHWQKQLPPDDHQALDAAKMAWLETLEAHCQNKLLELARIDEVLDETSPDTRDRLELRKSAMQNIEKIIKSVQTTLIRLQARDTLRDYKTEAAPSTTIIVSNEWLAALPDD